MEVNWVLVILDFLFEFALNTYKVLLAFLPYIYPISFSII